MLGWGGWLVGEGEGCQGVLTPPFLYRRAFTITGRRRPSTRISLGFYLTMSAQSVFRPCFGLISGINNTNMVVKVLS